MAPLCLLAVVQTLDSTTLRSLTLHTMTPLAQASHARVVYLRAPTILTWIALAMDLICIWSVLLTILMTISILSVPTIMPLLSV